MLTLLLCASASDVEEIPFRSDPYSGQLQKAHRSLNNAAILNYQDTERYHHQSNVYEGQANTDPLVCQCNLCCPWLELS